MDPFSRLSLCSISRLEQLVCNVSFFGRVKGSGKDAATSVRDTAGAVVMSAGERGVAVDALNTPGSRRVVLVDQYSCTSVWRAMSLEFGNIWQSRVTWKEYACVWR